MGLFGIGIGNRATSAPLGNASQQSIASPETSPRAVNLGPNQIIGQSSVNGSLQSLITGRNVNILTVSPDIVSQVKPPPVLRFVPPILNFIPPPKRYEEDNLRVSQFRVVNGKFENVEKNGVSVFRPEIVSLMNFVPVDGNGRLGSRNATESAEQLIKSQFQAIEVRAITIQKLMKDIRAKRDFKVQLDTIKSNFVNGLTSTKTTLAYFADLIDKIDSVKASLDPKKIKVSAFDTTNFLGLQDFYERKMQYSKAKFANFSDTKIINQLISDLGNILEGYSLALFDLTDPDRSVDVSPVTIDKSYTQTNGFSFTPASVRSLTTPRMAFKSDFFNQFLNSLPPNADDRIKLLSHFLSKELRVSKELGKPEVAKTLREKYQQTDSGNPFDNIVGKVGETIFNEPAGSNSLSSLTLFNINTNNLVLPFESIYVDSENERKIYVPGSTYFVDTILSVDVNGFNTQPFVSYVNTFNNVFGDAKNTIETLLELSQNSSLAPTAVYDIFLSSLSEATAGLASANGLNRGQAFCAALFKLANTDTTLKNMLFEYLLLLGLSSISNVDQKNIFLRLASEVGRIQNFQFAKSNARDNPSLVGGQSSLRPYIEDIAADIEDKIFALVNTAYIPLLDPNFARNVPSPTPETLSSAVSGPGSSFSTSGLGTQLLGAGKVLLTFKNGSYQVSFNKGEIKETLLNTITATGNSSTNLCKEFVDIAVKLDQNASLSSNQVYLLSDNTGRTRQNFLSTSTILLFVFETLAAFANRYTFSSFNKGVALINGSVTVDTGLSDGILKVIKDTVSAKPLLTIDPEVFENKPKLSGAVLAQAARAGTGPLAPFSLFNLDASRETTRTPEFSGQAGHRNASVLPNIYSPPLSSVVTTPVVALQSTINTPVFGFGKTLQNFPLLPLNLDQTIKLINYKKTILANRTKLNEEDKTIRNILHIFSVINKRLISSKELVIRTFTKTALDNFLKSTGSSLTDINLVKNISQVRVSSWIYDYYDESLADVGQDDEISDNDLGFLFTDRIPMVNLNAMFSMLKQPQYLHRNNSDFKVKIMSVGIPAGFGKNLSDRVSRTAINETNFKDKEFDVISINVYKRDARYDDLIFKPQTFIFDLSLFPIKNFLPAALNSPTVKYFDVIKNATLKDYESLQNKKNVRLANIAKDEQYSFLSTTQKNEMVKNHIESELLDLYIKLIAGIEINEETFTNTTYTKANIQDQAILGLILSFLKNVRRKDIPNQPVDQLLNNPNVDQESKDILRLLSYGNLTFQPDFIRRRVLEPKLFDRIFHIPINIDNFEIDVEATLSSDSGKNAYTKNAVQNMIYDVDGKKYLKPKERNDLVFEDYFVVVESNLSGGS